MTENVTNANENDQADHHGEKPSYDDVNVPVVVMVAFLSVIFTVVVIAVVQGIYNQWSASFINERQYSVNDTRRDELIESQREKLQAGDNGRTSIEEAMQNTLKEYSN